MKLKSHKILLLCLLLSLFSYLGIQAQEFTKIKLRKGISNFYNKLESKDTLRIVYFGGSITNAPGWRVKSFDWFEKQYPQNQFIQINASIGGTGSNLGAFRFKDDVIKYQPDLILMEFAVNDSRTEKAAILRQYEGILRQLWTAMPNTDICFVYAFKDEFAGAYNLGELPYTVIAAEEIADYYGIPSVNFGVEIMQRVNNETLIFRGKSEEENGIACFSKDGVHPFKDTGHRIYFEDFKAFESQLSKISKAKARSLPKAIFSDHWEKARYLDFKLVQFTGDWKYPDKKNKLYETESTSASLSFEFEGTMFGIYDWIGPSGTSIDITIDGKVQEKMRFDKHCNYNRANYFFIPNLPKGKHKVVIRMGRQISPEEKVEIVKERLNYAEDLRSTFIENKFRLAKIMIL